MEIKNSLGSTIEKIKLQEQDKEIKLKEKREMDATAVSLSRSIRDFTLQNEKSEQEQKILTNKIGLLRTQITLEKIRHDALTTQLHTYKKELDGLRTKSNEGISKVWYQRSSFCKEIHTVSDSYDVWALLMKPTFIEPLVHSIKKEEDTSHVLDSDTRLQAAIERRTNCIKERDRLKAEPDNGEEFLRIRNALRYSLEKIEELRK